MRVSRSPVIVLVVQSTSNSPHTYGTLPARMSACLVGSPDGSCDGRHVAGPAAGLLLGIAARLVPRPQRGADEELVLQVLVIEEVGVAGIGRAPRVAPPLAGQHRRAAEALGLVTGDLEGRGADGTAVE